MAAPTWQVLPSQPLNVQVSMADAQNHPDPAAAQYFELGNEHPRPAFAPPSLSFSDASSVPFRDYNDLTLNSVGPSLQSLPPLGSSLASAHPHIPPSHSSLGAVQPSLSPGKSIVSQGHAIRPSVQAAMPPEQVPSVPGHGSSGYSVGALQANIFHRPSQSSNPYPALSASSFLVSRWPQQGGASAPPAGARPSAETAIVGTGSATPAAALGAASSQLSGAVSGPLLSQPQPPFQNYTTASPVGPQPPWLMTKQAYPPYAPYTGYQLHFSRPIRPPQPYQDTATTFPLSQANQSASMWGSSPFPVIGQAHHVSKDVAGGLSGISSAPGLPIQVPPQSLTSTSDERSQVTNDHVSNMEAVEVGEAENREEDWTAHRTADGRVYYYDSVSGKSTYERPAGFKGEADKVTAQPTPVSWERISGTDWTMVITNDSKRYYYNTQTQATSWQVPQEVAQLKREQAEEASKHSSEAATSLIGIVDKGAAVSFSLSVPAAATGGRDAKGLVGNMASSALDLIKKKLQDVASPMVMNAATNNNGSLGPDLNNGKAVTVEIKKEKAISSDSSSESDDDDLAPTKEERILQFKEMLKEKNVAPFSKWEKELPKIIFDDRFKAIPSYTERRSIFEHYVKTRADEERKERRAALKAAIEGFKQLLEEAEKGITHATDYNNFAQVWSSDSRFQALERKDREVLLQERCTVLPVRVDLEN